MKRQAIKPFNPLQGLRDLDKSIADYLGRHMQRHEDKAMGYGPKPQMEGAGVLRKPNRQTFPGAWVLGEKKRKEYT